MARLATQVMLDKKLSELNLKHRKIPHFGVKEAVFPFNMFPEVDPLLGPEMRSTGEVLGMADSFGLAFFKSQQAAKQQLPDKGAVLMTVTDDDKKSALKVAELYKARWQIEIFFKWIKQHLRIKAFYGNSENAVKTQIWIAVTTYLLVAILKKELGLEQSLYTILQVLSVSLFERTPLQDAICDYLEAAEGAFNEGPLGKQLPLLE